MHCRLYALLIEKFGDNFIRLPHERIGHSGQLLESFEKALRKFTGKETQNLCLHLVMEDGFEHPSYDDEEGEVILSP
jgi:hypothetical protein